MGKMHFLALLTGYLENYGTKFHQIFHMDACWDRDECFNVWRQKVKGQGHSVTKAQRAETYRARRCASSCNFQLV